MKKLLAATLVIVVASAIFFISCEKNGSDPTPTPPTPTSTTCKDSAYLFADSIACAGKSVFHIQGSGKNIVMVNSITAIDTIVNGASFYITYDSVPGTEACLGALLTKAVITCYQRR